MPRHGKTVLGVEVSELKIGVVLATRNLDMRVVPCQALTRSCHFKHAVFMCHTYRILCSGSTQEALQGCHAREGAATDQTVQSQYPGMHTLRAQLFMRAGCYNITVTMTRTISFALCKGCYSASTKVTNGYVSKRGRGARDSVNVRST